MTTFDPITGFENVVDDVLKKVIPDPQAALQAKLAIMNAQQAIPLAEAESSDPWTSRARPTFMYVMYVIMLSCLPMALVYAFNPTMAHNIAEGMKEWLAAIPGQMWSLFGLAFGVNAVAEAHIAQPFFGGKS